MKLYLVRHGDYVLDTVQAKDVLSEKGIHDITSMAHLLKQSNVHVAAIFHSEKNRAMQTAGILAAGMICDQAPQLLQGLNPDDDVSVMANELMHGDENIMLVGHLPFMGRLVSLLVMGREDIEIVNFKTGTIVCLEQASQTRYIIEWVLTPEL
jgi:phosphohistidine phosphatase